MPVMATVVRNVPFPLSRSGFLFFVCLINQSPVGNCFAEPFLRPKPDVPELEAIYDIIRTSIPELALDMGVSESRNSWQDSSVSPLEWVSSSSVMPLKTGGVRSLCDVRLRANSVVGLAPNIFLLGDCILVHHPGSHQRLLCIDKSMSEFLGQRTTIQGNFFHLESDINQNTSTVVLKSVIYTNWFLVSTKLHLCL